MAWGNPYRRRAGCRQSNPISAKSKENHLDIQRLHNFHHDQFEGYKYGVYLKIRPILTI